MPKIKYKFQKSMRNISICLKQLFNPNFRIYNKKKNKIIKRQNKNFTNKLNLCFKLIKIKSLINKNSQ